MKTSSLLLSFSLLLQSICFTQTKVILADMQTVLRRYSDVYLGSFTYDKDGGKIIVKSNTAVKGQRLLFFDGAVESWPMVLKTYEELSCVGLRNISLLVTQDPHDGMLSEGLAIPKGKYEAELQLSATSNPERWYVMASNCDDVIDMELNLTLLNPGGWWSRQFSVDEQGLLGTFASFLALYTVSLFYLAYSRGDELLRDHKTPLSRLFMAAVFLEYISLLFQTLHGVRYASDGIGLVALQALGEVADAFSNCIMMIILIYIAKGFAQTRDVQDLPKGWLVNAGIFITGFLSLFVMDRIGRTMDQRYCYDSDIGVVIIVYRISAFVYFWVLLLRSEFQTSKREGDSGGGLGQPASRTYLKLCCTVWFLGVPCAYVASQFLPVWDQMRLVITVGLVLHTLGLMGLATLFNPSLSIPGVASPARVTPYDEI